MRITIESTTKIVTVGDGMECRVWEGATESGVAVEVLIPRIAVRADQDTRQFERELRECRAPSAGVQAFPLRMIL